MSLDVGNPAIRLTSTIAAQQREQVQTRATSAERASACEHLLAVVGSQDARRAAARRWAVRVSAGALVALAVFATTIGLGPTASGGDTLPKTRWVAASAEGLTLPLLPEATVDLRPHARARVLDVNQERLRLSLESGLASSRFAKFDGTFRWDAGPFSVTGSGADFFLSWDANAGLLEVSVTRGMVTAEGVEQSAHVVVAGQVLSLETE